MIIDNAMADDEEPLDHLLDDPDLEHFLNEIVEQWFWICSPQESASKDK